MTNCTSENWPVHSHGPTEHAHELHTGRCSYSFRGQSDYSESSSPFIVSLIHSKNTDWTSSGPGAVVGIALPLMLSLPNSQLLVLQPGFWSCLWAFGLEAVLGFPSFPTSLWLIPLWVPVSHEASGKNADPVLGHPPRHCPLVQCPSLSCLELSLPSAVCIGGVG